MVAGKDDILDIKVTRVSLSLHCLTSRCSPLWCLGRTTFLTPKCAECLLSLLCLTSRCSPLWWLGRTTTVRTQHGTGSRQSCLECPLLCQGEAGTSLELSMTTWSGEVCTAWRVWQPFCGAGYRGPLQITDHLPHTRSAVVPVDNKPSLCRLRTAVILRMFRMVGGHHDKSISHSSKIQLMLSLVTSIFLDACESWTLTAELQRRIQAMEMRCYRKILHIS